MQATRIDLYWKKLQLYEIVIFEKNLTKNYKYF